MAPSLPSTFLSKQADHPYVAGTSPEFAAQNEAMKAQALRKLLLLGLGSAGTGAGLGLLSHFLGNQDTPQVSADDPDVEVPYPQMTKKSSGLEAYYLGLTPAIYSGVGATAGGVRSVDKPGAGAVRGGLQGLGTGLAAGALGLGGNYLGRHAAGALARKMKAGQNLQALLESMGGGTGGLLSGVGGAIAGHKLTSKGLDAAMGPPPWEKKSDWADSVVKHVMPTPTGEPSPNVLSPQWFRGDTHDNKWNMPWMVPAAIGTSLGGLFGGNHLVHWLLKKRRREGLDNELAKATKEYESAMLGQYDPEKIHKLDDKTAASGDLLDRVCDHIEKDAGIANEVLGSGMGAYAALAALITGMTGYGTYQYLKGRSKSKMLANALKQRAMVRGLSNPSDVYLRPTPVQMDDPSSAMSSS